MVKKKNKKEKRIKNLDIAVTIIYTLVFFYGTYALIIMPEKLDIMNFILLGILLLPYLIRLIDKNMIPSVIALEILLIIIVGFIWLMWPTIKSSVDNSCDWPVGEKNG